MNVAVLMVEKVEVIVHDYQEIVLILYVPYITVPLVVQIPDTMRGNPFQTIRSKFPTYLANYNSCTHYDFKFFYSYVTDALTSITEKLDTKKCNTLTCPILSIFCP